MTSILKADTIQDTDGNNIINESGNTITIGASGDTTNIIGTLQNNGAAVGGTNTPAFEAYLGGSGGQSVSDNTLTLVQANTEVYDTDSAYDTSTYRFTPQTAGNYFCFYQIQSSWTGGSGPSVIQSKFIFNGSASSTLGSSDFVDYTNSVDMVLSSMQSGIITFNGSSDYLEIKHYSNAPSPRVDSKSYFGAYKIIQ